MRDLHKHSQRLLDLFGRVVNLVHLLDDPSAQHSHACGPMAINARMAVREVQRLKNHRHSSQRKSRSFVPLRHRGGEDRSDGVLIPDRSGSTTLVSAKSQKMGQGGGRSVHRHIEPLTARDGNYAQSQINCFSVSMWPIANWATQNINLQICAFWVGERSAADRLSDRGSPRGGEPVRVSFSCGPMLFLS